ncbi:hypothetical protein [Corynebacterium sp. NML120713]|uniref:hypothetical protein n=1 Tax=Corynebacterium sp. NML120713 TaxID=1906332 RepID=UPI0008FAF13F|nr:hypothetical protein [Corynebacterium sp. NML120713]OIR43201.1 hypothetical protein BJP06_06370 [Corynebacterium sp. NML120713]
MAGNNEAGAEKEAEVLPDWVRDKLTKANNEAAKYRTEKNEAVEKAKQEKEQLSEKVSQLEAALKEKGEEVQTERTEVEKLKAAIGAGIPTDKMITFAGLLKGETEEELVSHAEELKKLFVIEETTPAKSKATDPSQGSGGKHLPLNGDPLLESVMAVINKKR